METIGVLLVVERSGILSDIVRSILHAEPGVRVSGELDAADELPSSEELVESDAVVWIAGESCGTAGPTELLYRHPSLRVLVVEGDGREGFLWEMRPSREPLGELSPHRLVSALRMEGSP